MKKIFFVASEAQPFFASGGLGDVIGSLPKRILKNSKAEYSVSVILPLYEKLNKAYQNKLSFVGATTTNLSWRKQYTGIFKYEETGVKYYFIDNEYYFKRDKFYGYFDDAERFAFFSKAALEVMIYLDEIPDIIHLHDWQAGMTAVYLRTLYYHDERFKDVKTIFTIHNIEYQGIYNYDVDIIEDVFGLDQNDGYLLEYQGKVNIMKGAMEASNYVSTVSETYAEEILDPAFSHGLEYETRRIKEEHKLRGILNGIDKVFYNPAKDKALFKNYNKDDFFAKTKNKEELKTMLLMPQVDFPLIGMVTRLVEHKGLNMVKEIIEELLQEKVQMVILGTGDPYYEGYFKDLEYRYPSKIRVIIAYNQDLSRKIYAASDLFLMPSKSEPCGLSQMIASRYGAIPIVRATGGLKDSIIDFEKPNGNGYSFDSLDSKMLLKTIKRALKDYENKEKWFNLVKTVMNKDFGWSASSKKYLAMYDEILTKK